MKNNFTIQEEKFYKEYKSSFLESYPENGQLKFNNTNLSVFNIGYLLVNGVYKTKLIEEYPYLTLDDLRFAKIYYYKQLSKSGDFIQQETALEKMRQVEQKDKSKHE